MYYSVPPALAVKTIDKAGNISSVSNSPYSLPQVSNVYINEIYPSGSAAADDWIELYNNTSDTFTLTGWTLIYNQGTIDLPGAEITVWTGVAGDTINVNSSFLIVPSADLNGAESYHVILKDSDENVIDRVQWPALSSGESFARIYDGNADFFEVDPTPSKNYANSISTDAVKINEISYGALTDEFIEIFNTSFISTLTLTGYSLRNSNGVKFVFDRIVYPQDYSLLDFSSISNDALSYSSAFGTNGLVADGDYLVLENSAGQTVDRVTWQGATYSLTNYKAEMVSASAYAPANVTYSIGRQPSEGSDSDSDSTDFATQNPATAGSRNNNAGLGTANTLNYPADNQVLPRRFPIKLTLGADSSQGRGNNIILTRTGGSTDNHSPHIYRLEDIGFDLASLSEQSTSHIGSDFYDQDGYPLVNGGVYKLMLNSDNGTQSAPQITVSTLTYDDTVHSAFALDMESLRVNTNSYDDAIRITISNNSPASYNDIEISSFRVKLMDSNLNPMLTADASTYFSAIMVVKDSGTVGIYESAVDIDAAAYVYASEMSLDAAGYQSLNIDYPDSVENSISASSTQYYFIVFELAQDTGIFRVGFDPTTDISLRDGPSDEVQEIAAGSVVNTSSITIIIPAGPPDGTMWPYDAGTAAAIETALDYVGDGTIYVTSNDGKIRALNSNGTLKWTYTADSGLPIRTGPLAWIDPPNIYFGDDNGDIYKIADSGVSASFVWKRPLSTTVRSDIIFSGNKLYFGGSDNKVYCLNASDGSDCAGWTYDAQVTAAISGTPSLDDYTDGVNAGWIGLEDGTVIKFRSVDGVVVSSFTTGGAVKSSPFVDAAYVGANNNLYITSTDGKLYARTSANLKTTPSNWSDFNADSPIYSSPFIWEVQGDKYVFFGDDSGKLYKVSATSGGAAGYYETFQAKGAIRTMPVVVSSGTFPGVYDDYIYFGCDDGYIYAVSANTMQLRDGWPVTTGGKVSGNPVVDIVNKVLLIGSQDGRTYKICISSSTANCQ